MPEMKGTLSAIKMDVLKDLYLVQMKIDAGENGQSQSGILTLKQMDVDRYKELIEGLGLDTRAPIQDFPIRITVERLIEKID